MLRFWWVHFPLCFRFLWLLPAHRPVSPWLWVWPWWPQLPPHRPALRRPHVHDWPPSCCCARRCGQMPQCWHQGKLEFFISCLICFGSSVLQLSISCTHYCWGWIPVSQSRTIGQANNNKKKEKRQDSSFALVWVAGRVLQILYSPSLMVSVHMLQWSV